jgi:redox-sensitive bicupin YhaK (pirin superfamily)
MKYVIHKSKSRGLGDYGWLKTNYSFSFAEYMNLDRMGFGVLRVLNDDNIAGGKGFGAHSHNNMEIITITLSGGLEHKDNIGNVSISKSGDVQVMSAGSGIVHSEFNAHPDNDLTLLQIWVLPNKMNVMPRYEHRYFDIKTKVNTFHQIICPIDSEGEGIGIYQGAWFQRAILEKDKSLNYSLKKSDNGVYIFVISGQIVINNNLKLKTRDAIAIWKINSVISISAEQDADILLMEVPI